MCMLVATPSEMEHNYPETLDNSFEATCPAGFADSRCKDLRLRKHRG